ncbi:triose phosphate isomerase [Auriculariales sp. MPI-PUGE-AT-0066]|nr:triose phosphate isomerase [Auriculariales sp. MPI-PUGE-AT-0066]
MTRKWFVCGNWNADVATLSAALDRANSLKVSALVPEIEVVVAAPSVFLIPVKEKLAGTKTLHGTTIGVAAQNTYITENPAYKGDMSVTKLAEVGIHYVILGHSQEQTLFSDTALVAAFKAKAAIAAGITVIYCVGETLEQREAGETLSTIDEQVQAVVEQLNEAAWSKMIIAYEPVWAIGAAKAATEKQVQPVHAHIRKYLETNVSPAVAAATRIIYGGAVTASNAGNLSIRPDVDGFLVGRSSLKGEFSSICNAKPSYKASS